MPAASSSTGTGLVSSALAANIAARQPLRWAGYVYDAESQMYYCSARTYDPKTRQFLSKDPARDDGEQSAYQYCGGDPVGKVDPSGLFSQTSGRMKLWTYALKHVFFAMVVGYVDYNMWVKWERLSGSRLRISATINWKGYGPAKPTVSTFAEFKQGGRRYRAALYWRPSIYRSGWECKSSVWVTRNWWQAVFLGVSGRIVNENIPGRLADSRGLWSQNPWGQSRIGCH